MTTQLPAPQNRIRLYGFTLKIVHWEPDELPSDGQWSDLREMLEKHSAKSIIWEVKPIKESTKRLKAMGLNSLAFDPCSNTPGQGNFLSVMRQNGENIKPAFD